MTSLKHQLGLKNFELALSSLSSFLTQAQDRDLDRSGVIKAFEFTYETCWKTLQKFADYEGSSVQSPRDAFKFALRKNWILLSNEKDWLSMIDDRNQTVHIYDVELAKSIYARIVKIYEPEFKKIMLQLKKASS